MGMHHPSSGPSERGGKPKFAFTYGTVEARLRVPAGKGLWSALWMLPAFGDSRPEVVIVFSLRDECVHPGREPTRDARSILAGKPARLRHWHRL